MAISDDFDDFDTPRRFQGGKQGEHSLDRRQSIVQMAIN